MLRALTPSVEVTMKERKSRLRLEQMQVTGCRDYEAHLSAVDAGLCALGQVVCV
jgi:hypothetical protein